MTSTGFESFDRPGGDLLAVSGLNNSDLWVVGEKGRILHWDGSDFFEYLPITRIRCAGYMSSIRTMFGPLVIPAQCCTGTAKPGRSMLPLNISIFKLLASQIRAKCWWAGWPVPIVGPFLPIPEPVNPTGLGQFMGSPIIGRVGEGATPTMTLVGLAEVSGFPLVALRRRSSSVSCSTTRPERCLGLMPIWPGDGFSGSPASTFRMAVSTSLTIMLLNAWRSWAIVDFPVTWW